MLIACKKENRTDCFKSNGDEISEIRNTGPFGMLRLNSKINLTINKGTEYKVELKAGKHIIKNISTSVSGDTLSIDNHNTCNFVRGYKKDVELFITVPSLKYLVNMSVGTVRFADNYYQDSLKVKVESSGDVHIHGNYKQIDVVSSGNGDVYLNGSCNTLYAYMYGTNYLHGSNLTVKDLAFIESVTIGDCFIDARQLQRFDYNIHKTGNIYYRGNPTEINNLSAVGNNKAIQKN